MSADMSKDLSRISAAVEKLNATADTLTQQVVSLSEHLHQLQDDLVFSPRVRQPARFSIHTVAVSSDRR